ncbi:carbohydrate-binding protein [Streptacidiphilus sp. PAMC 29251]
MSAGGVTQTVNFPSTPDYNTVVTLKVPVSLKAGTNTVAIANTAGTGPNLDRIVV